MLCPLLPGAYMQVSGTLVRLTVPSSSPLVDRCSALGLRRTRALLSATLRLPSLATTTLYCR